MAELGINLIVNSDILSKAPHCDHGPTLLFERVNNRRNGRFYACSACRDRKTCPFFMWEEDVDKRLANKAQNTQLEEKKQRKPRLKIKELAGSGCHLCRSCWRLLLPSQLSQHDRKHEVSELLSRDDLSRPTKLLSPLSSNKKEAQYFFTDRSTKFIADILKSQSFKRILCIGCPRLHEYLLSNEDLRIQSFLLDIDSRFVRVFIDSQPHCSSQFGWYNMFNHHFFDGESSRNNYLDFMRIVDDRSSLAVILDPPFGGLVEALAHTLSTINSESRDVERSKETNGIQKLPLFWIFPYFMEKRIVSTLPNMTMLEYKVGYENHRSFKVGGQSNRQSRSPIRIFTNVCPADVALPSSEGYRFCNVCRRYVAEENKHCDKCNECTSKDGRTYVHCEACKRCVKPNKKHCERCGRCHLPDKPCNFDASTTGCHICGDLYHKRRNCDRPERQRKRRKGVWQIKGNE